MTSTTALKAARVRSTPRSRVRRRTVGRGVGLPSGRAALGALMVSASVVGLYNASVRASAHPRATYLVAAHDLAPGHTLVADDLRTASLDLSPTLAGRAFGNPLRIVGASTLGPVAAGELLQAGALLRNESGSSGRELSLPIDASLAVAGTLRAGERIDIIATTGNGPDSTTELVVRHVLLVGVDHGGTTLSSKASMTLTLSLNSEADTLAVARALSTAQLLVVRSPAESPALVAVPAAASAS